mgnify:CR=1 FL=1
MPVCCVESLGPNALAFHSLPASEPEASLYLQRPLVPRLAQALQATEQSAVASRDCHLVSGGTGGLGLLTARWLAGRGASRVVLASRSGALARGTNAEWALLAASGAAVRIARCDAAEPVDARRLLAQAA